MASGAIIGVERAPDGIAIRTRHWQPGGPPWASALLVHGVGEHAGRYDHVGRQMAAAGIDVHAYDLRGFGGTGGRRAFVARWSVLHDDLALRLATVRAMTSTVPLVLYGHSMGGLIALGYVLGAVPRPMPDLLVLTSPGLDSSIAGWKQALAPLLGRIVPWLRIPNGFAIGALSRDPAVEARVAADPLCLRSSTTRLGAEAFAEQARVRSMLAAGAPLAMPTYVVHGTDDAIVPVTASAPLADDRPNVTRRLYAGLRHETHNEPEGQSVIDDTIGWIRDQVPGGT